MYFGIFLGIIAPKNIIIVRTRSYVLLSEIWALIPLEYRNIYCVEQEGQKSIRVSLPDKSRNLSSYITECGSSEKFEILLEQCQLIHNQERFSVSFSLSALVQCCFSAVALLCLCVDQAVHLTFSYSQRVYRLQHFGITYTVLCDAKTAHCMYIITYRYVWEIKDERLRYIQMRGQG